MNGLAQIVNPACVCFLLMAPLQAADGLTVKSGSFTYDSHLGHVTLVGTSGLRIQATVGAEPIEVSAPFTVTGSLAYGQGADGFPIVESFSGGGTATATFVPNFDQSAWQFVSAVYVFE